MKIKKIIQIIILSLLLYSCGTGIKDALQGKKRSENSDEFLIKKKNPLILPPNYGVLPVPSSGTEKQKKGKARSKQFGRVEIPQEAFIGVLKINKE